MHEEHAEGDKITGRKFSGHPAAPKFITQRRWVVRERATERPFAGLRRFGFCWLVGAESIDVTVNIFFQQVRALMRALEHHEAAQFEGDVAVRYPAGHVSVRTAAHVRQIAMRVRALAGPDGAQPRVIIMPNRFAVKLPIKFWQAA